MKALILFAYLVSLLFSFTAFAGDDDQSDQLNTAEIDLIFKSYCKTVEEQKADVPTDEMESFEEWIKSDEYLSGRKTFQDFLKNPAEKAKEMLESSEEGAALGPLMVCGVMNELKGRIDSQGCTADDGTALTSTKAVEVCDKLLKAVPQGAN